ncbi:MAG: 16S rRNA (adenine(1518)-N(6)/adenine(1519)-N(6))-dimethyltransferase RsmA [Leptolyngbyaceae cyanobacterium]
MTFSARPRKRFGQHWLKSERILSQIVAAANLQEGDRVLEIGPGTGILTQRLLPLAEHVTAIEVDRDLCQRLRQQFAATPNFQLIEGDILAAGWDRLLALAPAQPFPHKVVANIPYYITGPILERLLGTLSAPNPDPFESIVLLVQREIADRLCAAPGTKTVSGLTIRVQYLATCDLICEVPSQAFQPPPKVDSAVIRLQPRPFERLAQDPAWLERLLKVGFASKRKMLRNNLSTLVERSQVLDTFQQLSIPHKARAEDLGVTDWVALSNKMLEKGDTPST